MALTRWAPGGGDRIVAISTDLVSGRRIVPQPQVERGGASTAGPHR